MLVRDADAERGWPLLDTSRPPDMDGVLVVAVDLDHTAGDADLLDERERVRVARLRGVELTRRHLAAHSALRRILGWRLGVAPGGMDLATDPHGKPFLRHGTLAFNLSHSGAWALVALTADGVIGVDLEIGERLREVDQLATRVFGSAELVIFRALPSIQRRSAFLTAWTRKEAALKALGLGLPGGMEHVVVVEDPVRLRGDFTRLPALRDLLLHNLLTADGEARMVVTDRSEQRWRNQGAFNLGARRMTPDGSLGARVAYGRSDEPDEQTGERLLVDTWNASLTGDYTGRVHRLSAGVLFDRSDYQDASREFGEDDRDTNTYSVTAGYGLRLESGDELSLRAIADLRQYDHASANNQDSTGTHALIGWNRQVSETVGLSIEAGVEYRRYESTDTAAAEDVLSPTWLVNGSTITANKSTWSLTLSGGVEDSIGGNPALGSRAKLGWKRPLSPTWSVQAYAEGFNLRDLESVSGQPKDETWTIRGVLGASHVLRPGLAADIDGGYEYSDSDLQGNYSRMVVQVGMTARF